MTSLRILWSPRLLLAGRTFRLPVQADSPDLILGAEGFRQLARRWSEPDRILFHYLQAPDQSGDLEIRVSQDGRSNRVRIQVRTLEELRHPFRFNGVQWPRRWPVGQAWRSTKQRQTLQDEPLPPLGDEDALSWWLSLDDSTLWRQLPPAELPRAHFVNVHQGCPSCGTAIFRYGGFYPWKRSHHPADFRSVCPSCGAVFPSNDLVAGDFTSGSFVDDGYGYFDEEGHLFLFAATYCRDQVRAFGHAIGMLTHHLRANPSDQEAARTLSLMLLRYAVEEIYLAAVPQFRYGPSEGEEKPWRWGQIDWGVQEDPVAALAGKGMLRYCIDVPYISEGMALAYDAVWPLLKEDQELVERSQALGLEVEEPEDLVGLVEEMLASLLQCAMDRGASSNLPRVSEGALILLRALDRPDGQEVLEWLYDQGPDRLRVFGTNDFFPDGTPPEATGGYNSIHTNGLFSLENHLRRLRQDRPSTYPEDDFPSLVADPRAARVARVPFEITVIGRSWFQFGDGSAPGTSAQLGLEEEPGEGSIRMEQPLFHAPMEERTLERAVAFTGDPALSRLRETVSRGAHPRLGTTIHDGGGIAVLRTGEAPERAAVGVCYGDAVGHRHMDLLDVQLFAFERPFLTDLGYPQSWASIALWEAQWAVHNSVWAVCPGLDSGRIAGRGRLVRYLAEEGVQILEVEAERWAWDAEEERWYQPGVVFRRLLALVETDGKGVVLVDLSRIQGGGEHWRICRGLEGTFATEEYQQAVPGTLAGKEIERGRTGSLPHPDYVALAYMDQVSQVYARPFWRGTWQSIREPDVYLDLHQLRVSPGTQVRLARSTAIMGSPEESNYCYRTLSWCRRPDGSRESICVDLLFEPRLGPPTLAWAGTIPADDPEASGLALRTRGGRRIRIYWVPGAASGKRTVFEDATRIQGSLALRVDGEVAVQNTISLHLDGQEYPFPGGAAQEGRITALDRNACLVEVAGLEGVAPGDRVCVNPDGRAHTYRVERAERLESGKYRLELDVISLLGRGRIRRVQGGRIELDAFVLARTGNLHQTCLEVESTGAWRRIREAFNPDRDSTVLELEAPLEVEAGEWVRVVDYVEGDPVRFEPVQRCVVGGVEQV